MTGQVEHDDQRHPNREAVLAKIYSLYEVDFSCGRREREKEKENIHYSRQYQLVPGLVSI